MVSLHNYYLSIVLELECSTHLELVLIVSQLILLNFLQIVQFVESVNVGFQLDWNGVLKCL